MDKKQAKNQIVRLHSQVETEKKSYSVFEKAQQKLEDYQWQLENAKVELDQKLAEIRTQKEYVQIQEITADFGQQIKGIIDGFEFDPDNSGPLTLEDLKQHSEQSVDEDDFDNIMKDVSESSW